MSERTRTRSDYSYHSTDASWYIHQTLDGATTWYGSGSYPPATVRLKKEEDTMTDVVTDGFHTKKSQGHIINNNMRQEKLIVQHSMCNVVGHGEYWKNNDQNDEHRIIHVEGSWHCFSGGHLGFCSEDSTSLPNAASVPDINVRNLEAAAILDAQARAKASPINAYVSIGEAAETVRTIYFILTAIRNLLHPRKSGGKLVRELRRRMRNKSGYITWSDLSQVRDLWLEIRYGLRPLVYDLLGALEALRKIGDKSRARFSSHTHTDEGSSSGYTGQHSIDDFIDLTSETTCTRRVESHAGLLVQPHLKELTLAQLIGLGQPITGLWDLVPYSFVIDWFVDVAEYLAAWSPSWDFTPLASWVVTHDVTTHTRCINPEGSSLKSLYSGSWHRQGNPGVPTWGGEVSITSSVKTRRVDPSLPVLPSLSIQMSGARGADLLALASNFIMMKKGGKRTRNWKS